ncbi:ABC transporter ATP-binding protein [Tritonibacter mobilis]|nr:ABC transporter ATP-binding protein [Tritonibacter mobilis]
MTLTLCRVAKTYGDGTRALNPTDLEIDPGEIISLLGPSGCGKTTLLRLIAGLEVPDNGANIRFGDEDVTRLPVEKRNIGMVFQSYALFPNMSVRDNIGYGLKMQRLPRAEIQRRVDEVITLCRLEPYAHRAITALSGGQRQRVALARAFAPRPRLMLLDEPLSALDAALRLELRDELAALLRQFGTTVIFVTHDQDEALAIADRVAVMEGGISARSALQKSSIAIPNPLSWRNLSATRCHCAEKFPTGRSVSPAVPCRCRTMPQTVLSMCVQKICASTQKARSGHRWKLSPSSAPITGLGSPG